MVFSFIIPIAFEVQDVFVLFCFVCLFCFFVGRQLCWKDHFVFIRNVVCTDVCNNVGFSSTSKGKPLLSIEKAVTDFGQTWYVGNGGHKYYPCGLSSPNAHM